jgi:beta-N-acetylhexosaminidase|tara:strand:+ start:13939 stop:14991 length:1053 start_codon:yes stop_codon:yes gene_type:complete
MITSPKDKSTLIGQMLMVGLQGTSPEDAKSFFNSLDGFPIGGVILYDQNMTSTPPSSHNILSPAQVKAFNETLQSLSETPLLIGVDQEGGQVNRLKKEYGFPATISWAHLGKINDVEETRKQAELTAQTLSDHGFNINFAPVLDLAMNSSSFIAKKERCCSDNPYIVYEHAKVMIDCHLNYRVLTVGKHFPGQGSSGEDTHEEFVDVTDSWSEIELMPYRKLIENQSLNAVMSSHLFQRGLDPDHPATLSFNILNKLLRKELEFNGIIFSDDPQMKAISDHYDLKKTLELMINAGVDIFCFGNNLIYDPDIVKKVHMTIGQLLEEKSISEDQLRLSFQRIMNLKSMIGLV